jgi:Kef-type K+ transport system membrane component KefB
MASSDFTFVFLLLSIFLFLLKATQFVSSRFGIPKVTGEILLGIILGPTVIGLLTLDGSSVSILSTLIHVSTSEILVSTEIILFIAEIAVLLLLFEVGLEMDINSLKRSGKSAFLTALGGVILPFFGGFILIFALVEGNNSIILPNVPVVDVALFFAATLTATSIGISISIFIELDKLHAPAARTMIGAAVIDDILAILLLTITLTYIEEEAAFSLAAILDVVVIFISILIFFVLAILFGMFILPKIINRLQNVKDRYLPIMTALILLFFCSWFASQMHLTPIIGAFIAGVLLNPYQEEITENIIEQLGPFGHWVVPIFFVSVGLRVNLVSILSLDVLVIAIIIIVIAVLTKVIGSGLGALLGKTSLIDSYIVGVAMSARGEIILIFASVALSSGIFSDIIYSSLVLLVVITSLIVPVVLKYSYKLIEENKKQVI